MHEQRRLVRADEVAPAVSAEEAFQHLGRFGGIVQDELGVVQIGSSADFVEQEEMGRRTARQVLEAFVDDARQQPGRNELPFLITGADCGGHRARLQLLCV